MQVIFAGGASGVGASCLAIELADQWIVVDAGVRVDRKADPLPDLGTIRRKRCPCHLRNAMLYAGPHWCPATHSSSVS